MNAKAAKGKWADGRRPDGYTIDPATSKLVPHPGEAPHVQEMFWLYTRQRLGTRAIANELTRVRGPLAYRQYSATNSPAT